MEYKIDAESFFELVDSMDGTLKFVTDQRTPYKHSMVTVLGVWWHVKTGALVGATFESDYNEGALDYLVDIENNMVSLKPLQIDAVMVYSIIEE